MKLWKKMSPRLRVIDDRGVEREVLHRGSLEDVDEQTRHAMALASQSETARKRAIDAPRPLKIGVSIVAIVVLCWVLATCAGWVPLTKYMKVVCAAFLISLTVMVLMMQRWQRDDQKYADILLSNGICPVCAYRLGGLLTAEDDTVECTECGAAWENSKVGELPDATKRTSSERRIIEWFFATPIPWSIRAIEDDTESKRFLLDGRFDRAIRTASSEEHRETLKSVRSKLRRSARFRRGVTYVVVPASALSVSGFYVAIIGFLPPLSWTTAGVFQILMSLFVIFICATTLICAFWAINPFGHSANKWEAIYQMRHSRLCPACGEDLKDTTPDDEGLTRCPRCVARWRIPS